MEKNQVQAGLDYIWNMPPRADRPRRIAFIRVTSAVRWDEEAGRRGGDYVADAVFLRYDGTTEPVRYPIGVRYLDPVAYQQDIKKGDVLYWQGKDPARGYYYTKVVANGPRDDETGTVPVIWHHDRASRDGLKPPGDSLCNIPNRYLFRQETVDVMRATQTSSPQRRTTYPTGSEKTAGVREHPSDAPNPAYATKEDLDGVESDGKITAKAALAAMGAYALSSPEKELLVKHLAQIAGVKPTV